MLTSASMLQSERYGVNFLYQQVASLDSAISLDWAASPHKTDLDAVWGMLTQNPQASPTIVQVSTKGPAQHSQVLPLCKIHAVGEVGMRLFVNMPPETLFGLMVVPAQGYAWLTRGHQPGSGLIYWTADSSASTRCAWMWYSEAWAGWYWA